MAMTKCKECKKDVSDLAEVCPHCGIKEPGIAQVSERISNELEVAPKKKPTMECKGCRNAVSNLDATCPHCGIKNPGILPVVKKTVCTGCRKDIPKHAKVCPHCRKSISNEEFENKVGCLLVIVIVVSILFFLLFSSEEATEGVKQVPEQVQQEELCKASLSCWGEEHKVAAAVYCKDHVEDLAKYNHEWTDGFLEPKFGYYRWKNIAEGTLTYIGDSIKFHNGFNAWQNYVYECDYDPINKRVLDVRAQVGRL